MSSMTRSRVEMDPSDLSKLKARRKEILAAIQAIQDNQVVAVRKHCSANEPAKEQVASE